jgi:hypothetical protein
VEKNVFLSLGFAKRDEKYAYGNGKMAPCAILHRVRQILL